RKLLTESAFVNTRSWAWEGLTLVTVGWLSKLTIITAVFCAPNVFGTVAAASTVSWSALLPSARAWTTRRPRTRKRSPDWSTGGVAAKWRDSRNPRDFSQWW